MLKPVVTIFSSVPRIASSIQAAESELSIVEVVDEALGGYEGTTVLFNPSSLQKLSHEQLIAAEILITEPAVLAKLYQHGLLKNLKWCHSTYTGVDALFNILHDDNNKTTLPDVVPTFTLTRFGGAFGLPIAEWCMARIIAHERSFDVYRKYQDQRQWARGQITQYRYLRDLTMVILGVGDIGLCIGQAAQVFGMTVVGYARTERNDAALTSCTIDFRTALQKADYLVNVLPSTRETRGMLADDRLHLASLEAGGKCPVFVNVGRGDIIDERSLIAALEKRYISAAILDVYDREPLPLDSLLWERPDVIISPHVSGTTRSEDVPSLFLENYQRYVNKKYLKYVVDWRKGY